MKINKKKCVNCEECIVYCPVSAIVKINNGVVVDEDKCIECMVCLNDGICKQNAFVESKGINEWPRAIRRDFSLISSRLSNLFKDLKVRGMKNANAIEYYKRGYVGFRIEVGRPVMGTSFRQLKEITTTLAAEGVSFGEEYSTTFLMSNDGKIRAELLDERAGNLWFGFSVPVHKAPRIIDVLYKAAAKCESPVSVGIITRLEPDDTIPIEKVLANGNYMLAPNGKANLDLPVTLI